MLLHCHHHIYYLHTSFWEALLPELLSALIGFGGAFILFRKGLKKDKEREAEKLNKELKDYFIYLKLSIQRTLVPAINQQKSFKELIKQLSITSSRREKIGKERKVVDLKLNDVTSFNFRWFDEIDKLKIQVSFFKFFPGDIKDKTYYYNQMLSRIDLMDTIKRNWMDEIRKLIETDGKYEDLFNQSKMFPLKIIDNIGIHLESLNRDFNKLPEFEMDMLEIGKDWLSIPEPKRHDIFVTYDKFFKNLTPLMKKYQTVMPDIILGMLDSLRMCNYAIGSFEKNQKVAHHLFKSYSRGILFSVKRLNVILKKMENVN